jgi:hypothetical protein
MMPILASVLFLTYNQEQLVQEAFQSLLDQDYDNLEIVVSDDGSRDGTWEVISQMAKQYTGPKKIVLNRNETNLGVIRNFYKAFGLSAGELLFPAAGDDVSLPSRCSECIHLWLECDKKPDLIATDGFDMLFDGTIVGIKETENLQDWDVTRWSKRRPYMFGASHMLTRRLLAIRTLGSLVHAEDQLFIIRALMMGGAMRCAAPLIKHRRGGVSQTQHLGTYQEKKARLFKSSQQALLERDEILLDAACLDMDMRWAVEDGLQFNTFALQMLRANSAHQKFSAVLSHKQVSWKKRIKLLSFTSLPVLHSVALRLKKYFRSR